MRSIRFTDVYERSRKNNLASRPFDWQGCPDTVLSTRLKVTVVPIREIRVIRDSLFCHELHEFHEHPIDA